MMRYLSFPTCCVEMGGKYVHVVLGCNMSRSGCIIQMLSVHT